ncbi:DUF5801 repeats-in-toxin domain-containing protein [Pseudomonas sp. GWSMS-1]|uniref:DUF5801 repeats-in-toxin domain-containing protein n=1 Tax=Pseudomonas sp. GWSMS-1 TaxID=3308997 RepID=UPI003CF2A134
MTQHLKAKQLLLVLVLVGRQVQWGGHSFVLLGETAGALEPIIGFPTEGLSSGPEFPNPEPVAADDSSPTVGIIYFDQEGSVVAGPGVVEEAALNPGAPTNLDGQAGSNPGSNAENVSGSLVINSPDGISAIQVLDKDGVWINVQGGGVVQGAYGQLVFDAAGNWTYTLADNTLNHSNPDAVGADDQLLDPFLVRVFDGDGDVSPTVPLTIAVYDDGPSILRFDISEQSGLLVVDESVGTGGSTKDESGQAQNNDETSYAGSEAGVIGYASFNLESIFSLAVDPGADGENLEARAFSLTLSESGADSGLTATAGGPILLSFVGGGGADAGDILGIADGGLVVFRISINSSTGAVSVTQYAAVDHGNDGNNHDSMAVIGDGLVGVTVKIYDNDGDSATSESVELGSRIGFEDDGPVAQLSEQSGELGTVRVDESLVSFGGVQGDGIPSAVLSAAVVQSQFDSAFGADGAAAGDDATVYSLELSGADVPSGLYAVDASAPLGQGEQIVLNQVGNVVTGSAGGVPYFTLTIDPVSGEVTLDLLDNIWHDDTADADDSEVLSLAEGALLLTQTVTDGDGDSDSVSIDLGAASAFSFEDDGPTAGNVVATPVLDDEGLSGGINGGPGDVAGAATSTSGNLAFDAGADGLKSIAFSGPLSLGSEAVTSDWDALSNTLTISSGRGALLTVVLTDPASGAYTINLLQPLMHPVIGTEDDITLNIGYTVTDGDNDSATGSLVVTIDDDTPTIQAGSLGVSSFVTFQGTDAGFSNSYGYYNKAPDGTPVDGKVIWANVQDQSVSDVADLSGLDPANTGFFIIPNGGANPGLANGTSVTFEFVSGQWQATVGGVPLVGADGANVLFSDASLNPGGSHLQDIGSVGNQNWEDKTLTSDYDYNDVSTNVTWGSALQVDESTFHINATASFSGVFNVQPGADGLHSLTPLSYNLIVHDVNSGLVDTETNQAVILSLNAGVIEGRTSGTNQLVFTLSVDAAGTVTLDQLRAIVHPTGDPDEAKFLGEGHVSLNAVVTDGDGDQASASIDIGTVISFKDDGPSVLPNDLVQLDDDALASGVPSGIGDDNAVNISGTLGHDFGADGAGTVQWLASVAPAGFTYATNSEGSLLISQGATLVLTVTLDNASGVYAVTHNAPISHPAGLDENNVEFNLAYNVTDKDGDSATGSLRINVDDDTPMASDDSPSCIIQSPLPLVNVTLVLDTSGSMSVAKLTALKAAVADLAQAYAALDAPIHVNLVTFATNSVNVGDYSFNSVGDAGYTDLINDVNGLAADGWTNYAAALSTAEAQILLDVNAPGADAAQQHKLYFISDGNPEPNAANQVPAINAWNDFIENGNIDSDGLPVTNAFQAYAIGINVNNGQYLNPVASSGTYILATPENLSATLVDLVSVGGVVAGNVLANDASGADGVGRIDSIALGAKTFALNADGTDINVSGAGPVTYSFDASSKVLTLITELGTLKIDLQGSNVGEYSFVSKTNLSAANFGDDGKVEQLFTYTLVDGDGDKDSASLEICILNDQSVLVVGENFSDDADSDVPHFIASPFDTVLGGVIHGVGGNDVLIGDVGGATQLPGQKANIVYVLDNSGSMDSNITFTNAQGVTSNITRLEALKQSVISSLNDLYNSGASDIKVHLVRFGTNAPVGSTFTLTASGVGDSAQLDAAITFISVMTANGSATSGEFTNYEAGLVRANNWIQSADPVAAADLNKLIFVSDGSPNRALQEDGESTVVSVNESDAMNHVLGIGSGDTVSEVALIDGAGFTIESIGISVSATQLGRLDQIDSGEADNVTTANQLSAVIGSLAGGAIDVAGVGDDVLNGGGATISFLATVFMQITLMAAGRRS